jgi:hypothetical protein
MSASKCGAILAAGILVAAGAFVMPSAVEAKGPPGTPGSVVPGKPGNQSIVEIALAVNEETGEVACPLPPLAA